jgi:hypothetical protein
MAITQDAGTVAAACVKIGGGRVLGLRVTNINAGIRYVCLVAKATAPVNSDPIVMWFLLPPQVSATVPSVTIITTLDLGNQGVVVPTGVSWAISTSPTTLTLATAADHTVSIRTT